MGDEHIERDRDDRDDADDKVGIQPAFGFTPIEQELDACQRQMMGDMLGYDPYAPIFARTGVAAEAGLQGTNHPDLPEF